VYIQQMLTLTPTSKVSINQSFTYLNEFNDANTTRTVLTLKAQFPVTKYLSIVSTYTSKYQTQPTVPGAATISESRNATFTNGVKITF
jgi:hypothetical protein